MSTKLTGIRKATKQEQKENDAEVVFTREDDRGREYTIYGRKLYESWEQWGAIRDVLSDNVPTIEAWRNGGATLAAEIDDDEEED